MENELLPPCPRCGFESEGAFYSCENWLRCMAPGCRLQSASFHTKAEALEWWKQPFNQQAEVRRLREALEHYADEDNWQEDNTTELTTYVVWKHFPDEGNELYSGPDIAKAALKDVPPYQPQGEANE